MQNKIRIAILEDLEEVAEELRSIISSQEDMLCSQIFHKAEDAMELLPAQAVDILVVDIGLPRASGIEAIEHLIQICPDTQFCMFTVYEDDDKIFRSLQAGAKGYILKTSETHKILEALRELYHGGSPMSPTIARRILEIFQKMQLPVQDLKLPITARENELLVYLSKGLLYKEIADLMGITMGTVKQHIHKIYEKLQVCNRTEAINKLNQIKTRI
ncbi:MAG: response regulator transcription factor [Saprospiraceae bacterium]|nr:response regulator transcription factor [Saprospiraceae bacterium]